MASNPPECGFSCPFDGEARERIAVLEAEQRHTRETQDAMLIEIKNMNKNLTQITYTLLEYSTKLNTASAVGWTALSLWTRALAFILGGIGTLFGAAWAVGQFLGVKVVLP